LTFLGVLAAALHLALLALGAADLRLVTKPVPVLCLMGWVLAQGRTRYGTRIALGLAASSVGDVLLEFEHLFLAGLGAFLCGHVAYTLAFLGETRRLALPRALPWLVVFAVVYGILWPGLGTLRGPVAVYAAVFAIELWRAWACVGVTARGRTAERLALGGALIFAVSDVLIGLTRFSAPLPGAAYAILVLYWLGQLLIALSVRPERRAA
jgi:uncharacterized membrane protein YhhN